MKSTRVQDLRGKLVEFWFVYRRDKAAVVGLAIFPTILAVAVFTDYIAPYNPYRRVGLPYQGPSWKHLLGTNDIGQDIFSEIVYGTRASLFIGFLAAISGTMIGTVAGLIAGYHGGRLTRY